MYHAAVIAGLIDQERRRTANAKDPYDRFLGQYHSVEEVDQAIAHFSTKLDGEGRLVDPRKSYTPQERQWVENEKILCTVDFTYWLTRYAWISNDQNINVRFNPTKAQQMVMNVWADLEWRGWAIVMIQLKARQLGVSTLTEMAVLHRALFYPDVNAIVASCDDDKSAKMFLMVERCWEQQPFWLIPDFDQHKVGKYLKLENKSSVSVESGNQMTGIGRGTTPQVVHLSELADFMDAGSLVDDALLHAVHQHSSTFLVLESTAMGFDNWWYKTWEVNERNWPKGTADLCPIFLPWFVGSDIYPTKTWLRQHPIPKDWEPNDKTELHATKAAVYVSTNALLKSVYPPDWTMPQEQQWFYEVKRQTAIEKKRLNKFMSEMPSDPNEAFQSTNIAAVDVEECIRYRDKARARPPLAVLGIRGHTEEIPLKFQPTRREIDPKHPFGKRVLHSYLGSVASTYELLPLKWGGYDEDPHGRLYVWEEPQDGCEYGIGVDMGDGVGQDRSVIEVVKRISMHEPWVQVAEFASPYMNSLDFWPIVQAVAIYYSVFFFGQKRQPKIVIECRGNGETVQLKLKLHGWSNFHQWLKYDTKKIEPAKAHHLGFFTNSWSRRMIIDKVLHVFNNEDIDLRSPWICDEFKRLERDEFKQQFKADAGGHDDRIMALAFVLWSLDALSLNIRSRRRFEDRDDDGDPVYTDAQSRDTGAAPIARGGLMPRARPLVAARARL